MTAKPERMMSSKVALENPHGPGVTIATPIPDAKDGSGTYPIRQAAQTPPETAATPPKARSKGLAGLSSPLQAMANIEKVMNLTDKKDWPKIVQWFHAEYPLPKPE